MKSNRLILVFFLTILLLSACKKDAVNKQFKIKYTIGCTDCMVVYSADQAGNQLTEYKKNSTWSYSFEGQQNQEVLLLAYNTGANPQAITASIWLNDTILKSRTTYCPISGVSFCVDTLK